MTSQHSSTVMALALDSAPHGEATGWRRGEHLVDALAYIDPLDDDDKAVVNALLEEEVRECWRLLEHGPDRQCTARLHWDIAIAFCAGCAAEEQHEAATGLPEGDAPPACQQA